MKDRYPYEIATPSMVLMDAIESQTEALPLTSNVGNLNSMLVKKHVKDIQEIREAAAKMNANILVLYTVQSRADERTYEIGPLNLIALGFLPNHHTKGQAIISMLMLDVDSGYVYGSAATTSTTKQLTNYWLISDALDSCAAEAELRAEEKMLAKFQELWTGVCNEYVNVTQSAS
ncbi:hypothetical protein [Poriferisphaera corsica]|nr:hypothetical protein [Poriferisphaera corsica]